MNKSAATYRIKSVPLVCSKWHEMMGDASMWSVVDVTPYARGTYHHPSHGDITNIGRLAAASQRWNAGADLAGKRAMLQPPLRRTQISSVLSCDPLY